MVSFSTKETIMTMQIDLKNTTIAKAIKAKLLSYNKTDKTISVELSDITTTFEVKEADDEFETLVGKNIHIDTTGVVSLSRVKPVKEKPAVARTSGCSEVHRKAFMKGL